MKKNLFVKVMSLAVVAATSFAVVACDNDAVSASDFGNTNSSAEQPNPKSSSSEVAKPESSSVTAQSSSDVVLSSSSVLETCVNVVGVVCSPCMEGYECPCHPCDLKKDKFAVDCSTGEKLACNGKEWSPILMSSSSNELCKHQTDVECEACPPGEKCICHPCDPNIDRESYDCTTNTDLKCIDGEWQTPDEFCPNGRWTTSCGNKEFHEPVCCTEEMRGTCKHISDYDGMTAQGDCVNQNGSSAVDCVTGDNYQCKDNNWQKVACMNVKPTECKPGMGGCGYRLCEPNGIKEIADCENGVIYVCNGEMWEVKKTEENQHCARGELEYCDACFEEGKFEGRYKCEGGKWRKYGMGDEICVHISDLRCEVGMVGCGACDPIYEGTLTKDCVTEWPYVCHNGFWSRLDVQPPVD